MDKKDRSSTQHKEVYMIDFKVSMNLNGRMKKYPVKAYKVTEDLFVHRSIDPVGRWDAWQLSHRIGYSIYMAPTKKQTVAVAKEVAGMADWSFTTLKEFKKLYRHGAFDDVTAFIRRTHWCQRGRE